MKKKILIVDDDTTITNFLTPLFAKKNYNAVIAEDGETALEKINLENPDLILSDVTMPGMDGFELYKKVQANPKTAETPFIFMTGMTAPTDQLKGLRMGADEYVTKPFDLRTLFDVIENVLVKAEKEHIDFSGNLEKMNLEDIVQLIEINQKTGELVFTVHKNVTIGSIIFKNGCVVNAVTDSLEGEEAFYDLIARREGYARFYSKEVETPEKIKGNTMSMLLEAVRMQDEGEALYSVVNDMNKTLYFKKENSSKINNDAGKKWISKILTMVENKRNMEQIINSGVMSRPRAECTLVEMINDGILQLKNEEKDSAEETAIILKDKVETDLVDLQKEKSLEDFPIQIITDSTVDLPVDYIQNHKLTVLPLHVQFGKQVLRDGVDLDPEHFYMMMKNSRMAPTTFPVSDDEFQEAFTDISTENDILGIFMSQKLNRTVENALHAKDWCYNTCWCQRKEKDIDCESPKIEILDSKLVSTGMGLLVMAAMEKIDAGWSVEEVKIYVQELIPKVRVFFMTNTMTYLKHNWQVKNNATLKRKKKHVVGIGNGTGCLEVFGQVKDRKDAQQLIERLIREDLLQYLGATPIKAAVMHSNYPDWADEMSRVITGRFNCESILQSKVGPIAGAHLGPGVVGVAYYPVLDS